MARMNEEKIARCRDPRLAMNCFGGQGKSEEEFSMPGTGWVRGKRERGESCQTMAFQMRMTDRRDEH